MFQIFDSSDNCYFNCMNNNINLTKLISKKFLYDYCNKYYYRFKIER